jgi:hypothetical protein
VRVEWYGLQGLLLMSVHAIPAKTERNEVETVLKNALEEKFDEVIVFGFKDGCAHIKRSKIENTLKTIGALEAAKVQLWTT